MILVVTIVSSPMPTKVCMSAHFIAGRVKRCLLLSSVNAAKCITVEDNLTSRYG